MSFQLKFKLIIILIINFIQDVSLSQCGNVFTENNSIITSENYPLSYSNSTMECFYLLKSNNNNNNKCTVSYHIEFLDFDIKQSIGCIDERLEIGYQDALCGNKNGSKIYLAENDNLKLKFIIGKHSEDDKYRGFKLLINRLDKCENIDTTDTDTETVMNEWALRPSSTPNTYLPPPPPPLKSCCSTNIFSSKTFFLSSPNFLYSLNSHYYNHNNHQQHPQHPQQKQEQEHHCIYTIKKSNSNVCRIRLYFHYFSLGYTTSYSCPLGYLKIDGKFICGCNSNLKLTSHFHNDYDQIILEYYSIETMGNNGKKSGFLIEVIQDECSKRYTPTVDIYEKQNRKFSTFLNTQPLQHQSIYSYPFIEQLPLINEQSRLSGNQFQHIYIFSSDHDQTVVPEKEETSYIDTSSINTILTNYYGYYQCLKWNENQYLKIYQQYGNNLYDICTTVIETTQMVNSCQVFAELSGIIQTPGYPLWYRYNENLCYRFHILHGYCSIQINFEDFIIEPSYNCSQSYLEINSNRYCGDYLKNKIVTIQAKDFQQINLISNSIYYINKIFSGKYQQIPCNYYHPTITTYSSHVNCIPNHRKYPHDDNSHNINPNNENCKKIIDEKSFTIENLYSQCSYLEIIIKKSSQYICQIHLNFEYFNLFCDMEYFNVNGHLYCGNLTGKQINSNFTIGNELKIFYQKHTTMENTNGNFIIHGKQTTENCNLNLPPPAKLLSTNDTFN